ncbi:hypothetical protein HDZ31DRAFT_42089 [Schizophyllum fasciatum]
MSDARSSSTTVRLDMLQSFKQEDWTLMPSPDTLKKMQALLQYNARAKASSRKDVTQVFSADEHEYELKFFGERSDPAEYPTIFVDAGDPSPRAFQHPYHDLPKIRSRIHPFFVVHEIKNFTTYRSHPGDARALKALHIAAANVARLWLNTPPPAFKYGPDIADEHRHTRSLAGSVEHTAAHNAESRTTNGRKANEAISADAAGAPPTTASSSSLGKRKRESEDDGGSPRLSPRALAASSKSRLYAEASAFQEWQDAIEVEDPDIRCTPSILQEEADAALACYAQEPSRAPSEIMRTGRRLPGVNVPIRQDRDTSRFTSCHWVEWKYHILLWGRRSDRLP